MKSGRGRYQNDENRQKKRAAQRKYMSYEDVPLEDYRDEEPMPNNLTRRFLKMFLILFLAVVAVMAVLNLEKLTPDNIGHWVQYDLLGKTDGDGYPTNFSGSTVSNGNFDRNVGGLPPPNLPAGALPLDSLKGLTSCRPQAFEKLAKNFCVDGAKSHSFFVSSLRTTTH